MSPRTSIAVAALGLSLVLAGCGSSESTSADSTVAPDEQVSETTAPSDTTGDTVPEGTNPAATVSVVDDATLGRVLVTSEGMTLYVFDSDNGTKSACSGACLDNWAPFVAESPTVGDKVSASVTTVSKADGAAADNQVAIDGHLLYLFAGDNAPGETNGADIANWHVVSPSGTAASPDTSGSMGG